MIPVNQPLFVGNEKKYLAECIDSGWISSDGPFVEKFEHAFAKSVHRKYGIAVSSGTAAIDIAIEAMDLEPYDEIIMPTFTIISCVQQMYKRNIVPVFVDSNPMTWNMDTSQIKAKITKKTKAIMPVHTYGLPVNMGDVMMLAANYDLKVIEDAAQAHGLKYLGEPCGSFGDISTFSFYPNKLVTSGEGGMIVTNNPELAVKCRSLRNLCFGEKRFVHYEMGWNYRMSNLQAAVGLAQLEMLQNSIRIKRTNGLYYSRMLKGVPAMLPPDRSIHEENMYWVYGMVAWEKSADRVMAELKEKGVQCRPFFYPLHLQPVLDYRDQYSYPVAENMSEHGFYIPSGLGLTVEQMNHVVKSVREVLQ